MSEEVLTADEVIQQIAEILPENDGESMPVQRTILFSNISKGTYRSKPV